MMKCNHTLSKFDIFYLFFQDITLPILVTNLIFKLCREHMDCLKFEFPWQCKNKKWLQLKHNDNFAEWLSTKVFFIIFLFL